MTFPTGEGKKARNFGRSGGGGPGEEEGSRGEGRVPKSWTNTHQHTHTADTHTADTHGRHTQKTHTADTHKTTTQQHTHTKDTKSTIWANCRGFTRQPENTKRAHFRPRRFKHHQRKDTERETKRAKWWREKEKKKARNFGPPHPSRPPPLGASPFGLPPFEHPSNLPTSSGFGSPPFSTLLAHTVGVPTPPLTASLPPTPTPHLVNNGTTHDNSTHTHTSTTFLLSHLNFGVTLVSVWLQCPPTIKKLNN